MVDYTSVDNATLEDVNVPEQKYPSQGKEFRLNIYLRPEDQALFEPVAKKMHDLGYTGVLDGDGEPVKSEIVRQLLKYANTNRLNKRG